MYVGWTQGNPKESQVSSEVDRQIGHVVKSTPKATKYAGAGCLQQGQRAIPKNERQKKEKKERKWMCCLSQLRAMMRGTKLHQEYIRRQAACQHIGFGTVVCFISCSHPRGTSCLIMFAHAVAYQIQGQRFQGQARSRGRTIREKKQWQINGTQT